MNNNKLTYDKLKTVNFGFSIFDNLNFNPCNYV